MRVAFRVDASRRIGSGHVMRCLALAEELRRRGDEVMFVSRAHPGHLLDLIEDADFRLLCLDPPPADGTEADGLSEVPSHAAWLGLPEAADAAESIRVLEPVAPLDWLVVDHYALSCAWEQRLRTLSRCILVIDDLADRCHDTDVLVDSSLARDPAEYSPLIPPGARLLLGPDVAPLRSEFAVLRRAALARRSGTPGHRLLISFGGADANSTVLPVLAGLAGADLPEDLKVDVVLGPSTVDADAVCRAAATLPFGVEVEIGAPDLAERMVRADLAIGAAGTTAWERCCLGLPTLVITVADNQERNACELAGVGAIQWLGDTAAVKRAPGCVGAAAAALATDPQRLAAMAGAAFAVTDGHGVTRLADALHDPGFNMTSKIGDGQNCC